jgi:hypothetical protein
MDLVTVVTCYCGVMHGSCEVVDFMGYPDVLQRYWREGVRSVTA